MTITRKEIGRRKTGILSEIERTLAILGRNRGNTTQRKKAATRNTGIRKRRSLCNLIYAELGWADIMEVIMKYSEDLQMQIAFEHYVDCESIAKLGDRYEIPSDTVYRFCREHQGEFPGRYRANWKRSEKRMRRAVADYRNGNRGLYPMQVSHRRLPYIGHSVQKVPLILRTHQYSQKKSLQRRKRSPTLEIGKRKFCRWMHRKSPCMASITLGMEHGCNGSVMVESCDHGYIQRCMGRMQKLAQVKSYGVHNIGAAELKVQWYGWSSDDGKELKRLVCPAWDLL